MPCNATSQLTNAPSVPLQVTMPTNNAQWAVFVQRLQAAINATRDAANRQPVNVVPADFAVYNGSTLPALSIIGATSALDTTKHQFGAASLKLTATASTVTVEFSANPVLLQPNARWIESVYIQSSRPSIAGTLAIDTPGGSYPVDIAGTLIPATWGRLYGDCNLIADPSTTATMTLTLTGCTVGDTFNLEGWQIEHATGATNLPSPFVNTTVPQTYADTTANASEALANANAAQASANTANAQLAAIASDGTLSPAEKPVVIRDYSVVTNEQAGIDAQAVAFLGASSADQVAYDNAITALTNYLNTLTTPTAWNNKTGNTTVVAATFDATWNTVYEKRQILLNAIYQQAQSLANTAQTTANTGVSNAATAQTTANTAQTTGTNAQNTANTANTNANTALTQIGNLANSQYLQNPFFSTGDLTGWTSDHGSVYYETGGNGPSSASTSYAVFPHGTAAEALRNAGRIPVYPGAVIKAQCAVRGVGTPNGTCGVRISWRDATDAEISNTPTLNPSTGNATNGTYVTATAPAGAMFAHVECATAGRTDTTGYYTVDNFAAWALADSMDQVPDGVTRFGAVEAGADKTAGKSLTVLADRNLDNIGDSATYLRVVQQAQTETVDNANFEASTALPPPGWAVSGLTASYLTGANAYAGTQSLLCTATAQYQSVTSRRSYKCQPGDVWRVSGLLGTNASGAWAFGFVLNGGASPSIGVPASTPAATPFSLSYTMPAGATSFQIILFYNGTVSGGTCGLDNVTLARVRNADTEVADGTVNGRMAMADVYNVSGANRVGLRVAGSGHQLGDQFNSPPIASANLRSTWTGQTISYSATSGTPATATISVTAATLLMGDASKPYNAMSVSVAGTNNTNVTYYLYLDDPTYAGGAQTLVATTTNSAVYSSNGRVYVGAVTVGFPASGSGSGTGSGGGGACVALGSFGPQRRFDETIRMVGTPDGDASVRKLRVSHQKCVHIVCENGTALVCSEDAPLMSGTRRVLAADSLGEIIDTSIGPSRVASVAIEGILPVVSIDAGDVAYYAGESQEGPFILHHNKIIP